MNAPHGEHGTNQQICSACGNINRRANQRYCHSCHAAYERDWRKMSQIKSLQQITEKHCTQHGQTNNPAS